MYIKFNGGGVSQQATMTSHIIASHAFYNLSERVLSCTSSTASARCGATSTTSAAAALAPYEYGTYSVSIIQRDERNVGAG